MLSRIISSVVLIAIVGFAIYYEFRHELISIVALITYFEIINIANLSHYQKPWYGNGELTKPTLLYYFLSIAIPFNFYITMNSMTNLLLIRLLIVVWTTDTCSYIIGSIFKGPKLSIYSPQKTWTGFIGGILTATLMCNYLDIHVTVPIAVQLGDIVESMVKRNVNIKDSNYFINIPGHGGILDRIDGLLGALLLHQIINIDTYSFSISI